MADSYDVIVIGGGPGGYVAAIRAAQLGLNTAVVEKDKPGGRCLNYACIPAKTMLHTAEVFDHAQNGAELGIKVTRASIDWKALADRRAAVSDGLSSGVKMLWDKNKVTQIEGEGSLTDDGNVAVGSDTHETKAVVLATGSVALPIPGVEFSDRIVDTWGAWSLAAQPKKLAVVGAGASGSEIASAYARYGTEVTLIEMLPQILPLEDKDMARVVERTFKRQGITILTGTPISDVEDTGKSVKYKVGDTEGEADYLAIAGGRAPDVEALNLAGRQGRDRGVRPDQGRRVPADLRTRRSTRSETSSAAPHSPTRRPRKASSRSRRSPARRPTRSTSTWSRARRSAIRRSRASGSPRPRPRRPGTTSRSASSSSAASAPRRSTTTARAW